MKWEVFSFKNWPDLSYTGCTSCRAPLLSKHTPVSVKKTTELIQKTLSINSRGHEFAVAAAAPLMCVTPPCSSAFGFSVRVLFWKVTLLILGCFPFPHLSSLSPDCFHQFPITPQSVLSCPLSCCTCQLFVLVLVLFASFEKLFLEKKKKSQFFCWASFLKAFFGQDHFGS